MSTPRDVVLLGSTGSIGTQAVDIVRRNPDRFRVVALGAGGGNVELLAAQALELGVEAVGVAGASAAQDLQLAFYAEASRRGYPTGGYRIPRIVAGPDAMTDLAARLLENGHAYRTSDGSVFYDISSFDDYGKLSRIPLDEVRQACAHLSDPPGDPVLIREGRHPVVEATSPTPLRPSRRRGGGRVATGCGPASACRR